MTDHVDQDSPWKDLIDHEPARVLAFFYPDVHADLDWTRDWESLEQELRQIVPKTDLGKRIADLLLKAYQRGTGDPRYFHLEVQGQRQDEFPRRVHQYNYRAEERFQQHVVSLVILIDEDPAWRPTEYVATQYGCTRALTFRTVKLLDWAGKEAALERDENPVGLFVLAQLESRRTRDDPEERAKVKLRLILTLHARKMEEAELRLWYRLLDWLLPLPESLEKPLWEAVRRHEEEKKMPFITYAERYGMEKGLEKGLEKGREEGERAGLLAGLEVALRVKFGLDGGGLLPALRQVEDPGRLATILKAVEGAGSPDDLRKHLPGTTNGAPS